MAVDTLTFGALSAVYLAITLALGYLGYRRTRHAEDYMVAGRKAQPLVLALSYGASFISTSAIVGFGGAAAVYGMGLIWLTVLNIGLGIFIAFTVFGKRIRAIGKELGAVTFPDLMGKRYRSGFLQYASALLILAGMPLYAAAILIGGAQFLAIALSIPYVWALVIFAAITAVYVVFGGLIAVMYAGAFQGAVMLAGMSLLLIFTYLAIGGVVPGNQALTDMGSAVPQTLAAMGHTGWTSMPAPGSEIWFTLVTTLVLGVGIGVLAQPQLTVRLMAAKDSRTLNRAVAVGGLFILMMTGGAFTVGALSNVYFYYHDSPGGQIALQAAGNNIDRIIPIFIEHAMPSWFIVVFLLTLLAAAMSTLSSLFHAMGTAIGYDLWQHLKDRKPSLAANRAGIVVMIVVSGVLALVMPGSIIARATAMFFGLCASALLPAFAYGMFSEKPVAVAAKASLLTGAVVWFLWTAFVHKAESSVLGFSQVLFGKATLLGFPWNVIDPLVIALPLAVLVLAVITVRVHRRDAAGSG
jgi:SSS family solute:Na+ symporter